MNGLRSFLGMATRAGLGVGLAAAGVLGQAATANAGAYVRLSEIAQRYGLRVDSDMISGRETASDGVNRIVALPGGWQVCVNGRFAPLDERIACDEGDMLLPASAMPFIEQSLGAPRPVAQALPAPAPRPASPIVERAEAPAKPASVAHVHAGTIVIDPGHGGAFTGAQGRTGIYEKDITLAIARHVRTMLEERGWHVIMTRESDRSLHREINADLEARAEVANSSGADLFVSIHVNYAENTTAQGFEVYYYEPSHRGGLLARAIDRTLHASISDEDRGVKTANFRVIKKSHVPAVLVEVGFVSHPGTEKRLETDAYRTKLAEAIVAGIERYRGAN